MLRLMDQSRENCERKLVVFEFAAGVNFNPKSRGVPRRASECRRLSTVVDISGDGRRPGDDAMPR